MTEGTLYTVWGLSILILLVVTGVVALLLQLVLGAGRSILGVVRDIWTTGKMVASNTIHIPMLQETNRIGAAILKTAGQIVGGAAAIQQHAEGCPGCPECVLSR